MLSYIILYTQYIIYLLAMYALLTKVIMCIDICTTAAAIIIISRLYNSYILHYYVHTYYRLGTPS